MSADDRSDLYDFFEESLVNDNVLMIGATVDTGFEWQAVDECKEKLNKNDRVLQKRGKIYFKIQADQFDKVQEMRSVDNIFIVADISNIIFNRASKESDLQLFEEIVLNSMKLEKSLDAWKKVTGFMGKMYPSIVEYEEAYKEYKNSLNKTIEPVVSKGKIRGHKPSNTKETDVLRYRVTCERSGKHTFESGEAANAIGGALQDKYHWLVDLTTYHLEIMCKIIENDLITYLRVTYESKHRRNIRCFGFTTLRATICYNLLRLAHPKPGDIVIDPMCGSGSIPLEGALAYPASYILCGDNNPTAVRKTQCNIDGLVSDSKTNLLQWDVTRLPLKNSFVDAIVTDMPFGKRSGRITDNRVLYRQFLLEMGRVVKPSTGRMVLLTHDKRSFMLAIQKTGKLFRLTRILGVNMGGLQAAVYVLKRTDMTYEDFAIKCPKLFSAGNNTGK